MNIFIIVCRIFVCILFVLMAFWTESFCGRLGFKENLHKPIKICGFIGLLLEIILFGMDIFGLK